MDYSNRLSTLILLLGFLRSRAWCLLLLALCGGLFLINKYWMLPKITEVNAQKTAITARKAEEMDKLSINRLIDVLLSFAKVNSEGVWIHSMKIEQSSINLKVRSIEAKAIERYINKIIDLTNLKLESMVTKNVQYKAPEEEKEEAEKQEVIPFAVKLYLASVKDSGQEGGDEDEDNTTKDTIFFSYEAQIKLSASSR